MDSLKEATTESPGLFLIFAVINPNGDPDLLKRTFHDLSDFPTSIDEAVKASSPYLIDPVALLLRAAPARVPWYSYIVEYLRECGCRYFVRNITFIP